jgi:hypothetical protein
MTPTRLLLPAAFCLLTQAAHAATATPTPPPQKPRPGAYALELWRDPGFARFFLGTYSVFPDVEPPLKDSDKELLQQILPLMSKPTDAANAVVKLINKDSNAIFDLTLANIYLENDRMAQAELMFTQAVTKFPSFRRAWRGLGMTQVRQQKWLDAVTSLSRAIIMPASQKAG